MNCKNCGYGLKQRCANYEMTLSKMEKGTCDVCKETEKDKRIEELEKENAELKKKNLDIQDAVTMQMYTNKANKEIADRQLTKARELLKDVYKIAIHDWNDPKWHDQVLRKVAQFLKGGEE